MLPTWAYLAVALAIALVAFGLGQVLPGSGVPFVILASTAWTAYAGSRRKPFDHAS